jgi:uncharacterized Zn finger protein
MKPTADGGCSHTPTSTYVVQTRRGYRIRCLKCGTVSAEREEPEQAWKALRAGITADLTRLARE